MKTKITPIFSLAFLGLLLFQYSLLNADTLREKFEKTFKLKSGGKVVLSNTNGHVEVESWDRDEVRVEAEKIVKAGSRREAEEVMERVRIEINHDEDYLEIETRLPKRRGGGFWDWVFGDDVSISVQYRLIVPTELTLDVSTVNGHVDIDEVGGQIRVQSTNGHIKVFEAKGTVDARTTNGGIEVELLDFEEDEDMSFKTTNGGIKVYFPENFRAYVNASTTNGSIKTDFPIGVRGKLSKRRLRGEINGGGGRIGLHTTNGSIRILER